MKILVLATAIIALIGLAACKKPAADADDGAQGYHGRYVGIGVYGAGSMWAKMVRADQPSQSAQRSQGDPARQPGPARLLDDEHVIVVVDSRTGEIRQCGDLSGYCIGMNPWSKPLAASQGAPVSLSEHARPPVEDHDPAAATPASQGPKP